MIDSFDKLTIGKYKDIRDVLDRNLSEVETNMEIVAILNDLDVSDIGDMPLGAFNYLMRDMLFLYSEPKKRMVADRYRFGKYELNTMLNLKDMTVAQYVDYQEFLKDSDKYLTQILSVFLIPKGKKYNEGYDIVDVQRAIEDNMSIEEAISLSAFFLNLYQSLTKVTLTSLTKRMKRMEKKSRNKEEKRKLQEVIRHLETAGAGLV